MTDKWKISNKVRDILENLVEMTAGRISGYEDSPKHIDTAIQEISALYKRDEK